MVTQRMYRVRGIRAMFTNPKHHSKKVRALSHKPITRYNGYGIGKLRWKSGEAEEEKQG